MVVKRKTHEIPNTGLGDGSRLLPSGGAETSRGAILYRTELYVYLILRADFTP